MTSIHTGVTNLRQLKLILLFLFLSLVTQTVMAENPVLRVPQDLNTHDDGRAPIQQIYKAYAKLVDQGWSIDVIAQSMPEGTSQALPIIALRSPITGPAAWFLTGIHGEEPAGPNAMAESVNALASLGKTHAVVILPLCNPQGYARNWRYLNLPVYSKDVEGQSVGDSSHLLAAEAPASGARAMAASSTEADAITSYVLETARTYPPRYSIDLHEDNLIDEGYVYSQGVDGARDVLAGEAVNILQQNHIPIKMSGQTRFGEDIVNGIIGPVADSSIDELMSSKKILHDGKLVDGPGARTVLVFETPAARLSVDQRAAAHAALIRRLAELIGKSGS
jgi:hypothetical protein